MKNINDLFGIEKFNIIQDEKNYYFFRALNNGDYSDLKSKIITDKNGKITKIRTDRARYIENKNNSKAKYGESEKISLEQVRDHIKVNHRTDTKCISLSNNANVSIKYGRGSYSDTYVLITISKSEMGNTVINAGEYLLQEINTRIENTIQKISNKNIEPKNKEVLKILQQIEISNKDELYNIIQKMYKLSLNNNKNYTSKHITIENKVLMQNRYGNYTVLNAEQTLEKNKIIVKLTILEHKKIMKPIIKNTQTNVRLIEAIELAFSSNELIHYGEIPKEKINEIPKGYIDKIALLQQKIDKNPEQQKDIEKKEKELILQIIKD